MKQSGQNITYGDFPTLYIYIFGDGHRYSERRLETKLPLPDGRYIKITAYIVDTDISLLVDMELMTNNHLILDFDHGAVNKKTKNATYP